jgi:hypothetical protein
MHLDDLVQCRKKGAANYGNKSEGVAEGDHIMIAIYYYSARMGGEYGKGMTSPDPGLQMVQTTTLALVEPPTTFTKAKPNICPVLIRLVVDHWVMSRKGLEDEYIAPTR